MTIHHVYANRSNIGDWLSARGIQRLLSPLTVTEHLCDAPFVPETLNALAQLDASDLVIIGGGGLFMDYFTDFWTGLRAIRPKSQLNIWGAGCCDLKAEPTLPPLSEVTQIASEAAICVVRDDMSRSYLGGDPLPDPVACPSVAMIEAQAPGYGLLHVDNYTTVGEDAYEVMDEVCHRHAANTGRAFRKTNNRIEKGSEDALARCLALYAASDVVVSSALHGCIIAVCMGRRVIAVSGDRKIEGFMSMAGLSDWMIDHRDVHRLPRMLEDLSSQPSAAVFVTRARQQNRAIALEIQQMAADLDSKRSCRA